MSAEDPVVRRRKSRDLRRSRDISDETGAADRDTRRRSSTDGGVLNSAETPRLLREVSNMRLVVIGVMVTVPYTRAFARARTTIALPLRASPPVSTAPARCLPRVLCSLAPPHH